PGGCQRAVMANCSEGITQFASFRGRVADSIGGQQRKIQRAGNSNRGTVAGFFFTLEMTLQFDIDVARPKDCDQLIDAPPGFFDATLPQSSRQRPFHAAREADEAGSVLL